MDTWNILDKFQAPNFVRAIKLSSDNRTLFAAGSEELWAIDVSSGMRLWSTQAHVYKPDGVKVIRVGIGALETSPTQKMVATGGEDMSIILWNEETFEQIRTLTGHEWGVEAVAFTPDGKHLASCNTSEVCVWETETGKLLNRVKTVRGLGPREPGGREGPDIGPSSLIVSPTGSHIYVGDLGGRIMQYDLQKLIVASGK